MGSATSWDIEFGPMGFTPGTGTVESASTNPYTVNGLNPSAGYDFYVRANCGGGDVSNYTKKITAATACAPIAELPYMENFDAYPSNTTGTTSYLPYCWSNHIRRLPHHLHQRDLRRLRQQFPAFLFLL